MYYVWHGPRQQMMGGPITKLSNRTNYYYYDKQNKKRQEQYNAIVCCRFMRNVQRI
jgi:hypothetical protein